MEKNGIRLVGEQEWEQEVTQYPGLMTSTPKARAASPPFGEMHRTGNVSFPALLIPGC